MAGFTTYDHADDILDYFFNGTALPSIGATLYLRLLVVASTRSANGTETTYTGYAREPLPRDGTVFGASSNGSISNSVILEFPSPTSVGNGDIVAFDIVDTSSGAFTKRYRGGPVSPSKSIVIGKPPKFAVGALVITN